MRALRRETSSLIPGRAGRGHPVPGQALTVEVKRGPGYAVVSAAGEIDIATAPQLEEPLSDLAGAGHRLVADLSRVSFIDAAGLRVLARAAGQAAAQGTSLHVVCDRPQILRLFQFTGLDRRARMARTLAEALQAVTNVDLATCPILASRVSTGRARDPHRRRPRRVRDSRPLVIGQHPVTGGGAHRAVPDRPRVAPLAQSGPFAAAATTTWAMYALRASPALLAAASMTAYSSPVSVTSTRRVRGTGCRARRRPCPLTPVWLPSLITSLNS